MTDLVLLLQRVRATVLGEAAEALECARLRHYLASDPAENARRLASLYDAVQASAGGRNVLPMVRHAERIARERHRGGFDLAEVQTAFNVLEEALWRCIPREIPPEDYPQAYAMVSTVLGSGKQALALEYVSLTRAGDPTELDLQALFAGT